MSTPGARVIRAGGKWGILSGTGRAALFNSDGECPVCCGEVPFGACCLQSYPAMTVVGVDELPSESADPEPMFSTCDCNDGVDIGDCEYITGPLWQALFFWQGFGTGPYDQVDVLVGFDHPDVWTIGVYAWGMVWDPEMGEDVFQIVASWEGDLTGVTCADGGSLSFPSQQITGSRDPITVSLP